MKAQELRLGNFVLSKNKIDEVIGLSIMACFLKNQNVLAITGSLKPIPITEEWLLKFGFEKLSSEYLFNGFILQFWKYSNAYHYTGGEGVNYGIGSKYVHQLQNLYFALTGEELTLQND